MLRDAAGEEPSRILARILDDATARRADAALARADPVIARLLAAHGACRPSPARAPFDALATSVVNQQLSQRAAATILSRVVACTRRPGDDSAPALTSAGVLRADTETLRAAGLSARKAVCLQGLARAERAGRLAPSRWQALADDEVVADLVVHAGVGRWTAEMFLMFCLRRVDVVSPGDAGLRRAARVCYGDEFAGDDATLLERVAERWRPFRTVGCWHMWRSLSATGGALPEA